VFPALAIRAVAVAAAIGCCWLLLSRNASDHSCRDAGERVFATSGGFEPAAGLDRAIDAVRRECDGATGLLTAAETIRQASVGRPVLADRAVELAREGTRIEPESYVAWVTLAAALARGDPAAAREPFARAKELNPRLRTPASLRARQPVPR
jgi:hypothetical protein